MSSRRLSLLIAALCVAIPATAQVRVQVGVGIALSSALVQDSIRETVTVRPALAPTLSLFVDRPLESGYRLGAGLSVARSMVWRHAGDQSEEIVTLTVWQPMVRVTRALGVAELGARGGLHIYQAAVPIGLFRDGGTATLALGADAGLPGLSLGGVRFGINAEWALSRFSTVALRQSGFSGTQLVHRAGLRVTIGGGRRGA